MRFKTRRAPWSPMRIWIRILAWTAALALAHLILLLILPHLSVVERILSASGPGDLIYVLAALAFFALRLFTLVLAPGLAAAAACMLIMTRIKIKP